MLEDDLVDELHLLVYPVILGGGKRVIPEGMYQTFTLESAKPYPSGVVGLNYVRQR
jgi:dihydrofolate reductase